jgi:hypothetical protein
MYNTKITMKGIKLLIHNKHNKKIIICNSDKIEISNPNILYIIEPLQDDDKKKFIIANYNSSILICKIGLYRLDGLKIVCCPEYFNIIKVTCKNKFMYIVNNAKFKINGLDIIVTRSREYNRYVYNILIEVIGTKSLSGIEYYEISKVGESIKYNDLTFMVIG